MATYLENLKTARNQIAANLVEITVNPKPTYTDNGVTRNWRQLFDSYTQSLATLDAQIAANEPFEIETITYTDET